MATIVSKKEQKLATVRVQNQDLFGRNLSFEFHRVTGTSTASETTVECVTDIKKPLFVGVNSITASGFAGTYIAPLLVDATTKKLTITLSADLADGKELQVMIVGTT